MSINKSASRAVDVLSLLGENKKALSLSEIGEALDMPKSSTFEIMYTLLERGFVEQDENKLFRLGLKAFEVGSAYLNQTKLTDVARRHLLELSEKVEDTVFLAIENDGQVVYLDKVVGNASIVHTCDVGSRNYMHCTGLGKAMLAGYSDKEISSICEKWPLIRKTENTITNVDELLLEAKRIRKVGYAIDNKEGSDDLFCVAAPIYSIESRPIAAISVATFHFKMNPGRLEQLTALVAQTALAISRSLGYREEKLYLQK